MPCYGPDGPPNVRSDKAERRLFEAYKELDRATKAACELSCQLRPYAHLSKETQEWIAEHRKLDEKRRKK